MKAVVAPFNQEKALAGAFFMIVQLHRLIVYTALSSMDSIKKKMQSLANRRPALRQVVEEDCNFHLWNQTLT